MRMAALLTIDGLVPLGPDFVGTMRQHLEKADADELADNKMFKRINEAIPGDGANGKLAFITESVGAVSGWMEAFIYEHGVTVDNTLSSIGRFIELSDSKLDYIAAFLDMTTNYYEHTGIQTIARRLIERAVNEI